LPLCIGASGLLSNTWLNGLTQVHNPNGISIGSAVFAKLTTVSYRSRQTDRQTETGTDHAIRSRSHLRT